MDIGVQGPGWARWEGTVWWHRGMLIQQHLGVMEGRCCSFYSIPSDTYPGTIQRLFIWQLFRSLPSDTQQIPGRYQAGTRLVPGSYLAGAQQVPSTYPAIAWQSPGSCPAVAWRLPGGCLAVARRLPAVARRLPGRLPGSCARQLPGSCSAVAHRWPGGCPAFAWRRFPGSCARQLPSTFSSAAGRLPGRYPAAVRLPCSPLYAEHARLALTRCSHSIHTVFTQYSHSIHYSIHYSIHLQKPTFSRPARLERIIPARR